jgi:hypothetical protein
MLAKIEPRPAAVAAPLPTAKAGRAIGPARCSLPRSAAAAGEGAPTPSRARPRRRAQRSRNSPAATASDTPMEFHITMRIHRDAPVSISNFHRFSGAPVFSIHQDRTKQCHLGFARMIRLGENEIFHIYDASYVKRILDIYIGTSC